MQVRVYSPNLDIDRELREHVERRINFALDRLSRHVNWVGIRLGDLSTSQNANKQCKVQISLDGGATLSVEHFDGNIFNSVAGAADQAARAVSRHLQEPPAKYDTLTSARNRFEIPLGYAEVHHVDQSEPDGGGRKGPKRGRGRLPESPGKALLR